MNDTAPLKNFWIGTALCLAAAFLAFSEAGQTGMLAFLNHGLTYMGVFFHEIGHAVFGWFFGYVSMPTFDFQNGGGMAWHLDRSWPLQIIMGLAGAYGLYRLKNSDAVFFFWPLVILYLLLVAVSLTRYHEAMILFMGHGSEAIIGGFLLSRGFLNILLTRPQERWLNVFIGAFFIFNLENFCWQLLHDAAFQAMYEAQKGSHGFGDLSRIAEFSFRWSQNGVAIFLMIYTAIMAAGIPLLLRYLKSL